MPIIHPKVGKYRADDIIARASLILERLAALDIFPDDRIPAGFLTVRLTGYKCDMLHVMLGDPPSGKVEKYSRLSREKAARLASHLTKGHVSSWQSRSLDDELYGGAVRTSVCIISFSGLPEEADEALGTELAIQLGWMNMFAALEIGKVHGGNDFFDALHA